MKNFTPQVTFFLFAYNQSEYIQAACEAALAQTYTPLQIILSDDCSTDNTYQIMQDTVAKYKGPHQVTLNRNEHNLGLIGHVNRAMELTQADLIVVAAGDDTSVPERTEVIVDLYLKSDAKIFSIHSAVTKIDLNGEVIGCWIPPLFENQPSPMALAESMSLIIGATHAWTRKTFEVFGPINYSQAYEDLVIAYRSILLGGVYYIDVPLVNYRVGNGMSTADLAPKDRQERRARLIKNINVSIGVLEQRRDDCRTLGEGALVNILEKAIWSKQVCLFVYEKKVSIRRVFWSVIKNGGLKVFLKAYSRRLRKVI